MKIITIGRGENSHILIDNPMVSRQHALLKIKDNGKMTIVDKSSNGTSINGSRIKPDRETPVSRRDVVTFAGVSQLDWKDVPDPLKVYKIIGLVLAGLALALGIFLGVKALIPAKEPVFDPGTGTGAGIGTETGTGDSGNTGTAPSNDRTKQIDIDDLLKQIPENDVNDKPKPRPGPRPGPEPNPNPNPNPPVPTPDPAPKNVEQTVDPTFM